MIRKDAYAAHEAFIAPANPTRQLWKFVVGLVFAFAIYVVLNHFFFTGIHWLTSESAPGFADDMLRGDRPLPLLVLLGSFIFMAVAAGVVARVVHERGVLTLVGPLPLAVRQFMQVIVPLLIFGIIVFILPPWSMGGPLTPNLAIGLWAMLLPVSLLMIFVQITAEELVFRGYVQQQLAARFRSPLVWMFLPAVLFALGHYLPAQAGENAWVIALWAGFFGVLMADITARSGTLGPAIALHLFNNVSALLIVSVPDNLSGLSLFHAPFGLSDTEQVRAWLPVDFVHMLVAWLVARLAIRR